MSHRVFFGRDSFALLALCTPNGEGIAQGSKNVSLQCSLMFFSSVSADLSRRVDSKLPPRLNQAVDHPHVFRWAVDFSGWLVPVMRCRPGLPVFKFTGLSRHLTEANMKCGKRRNSFQHMAIIHSTCC